MERRVWFLQSRAIFDAPQSVAWSYQIHLAVSDSGSTEILSLHQTWIVTYVNDPGLCWLFY